MTPQDYIVAVRKLAEKFVENRTHGINENKKTLLLNLQNNPSAVQFHGFMVSIFAAYHGPHQCADIVACSPSQEVDRTAWQSLPPREALFAMGFELLKRDVWNSLMGMLEDELGEVFNKAGGEQLTMFGAA